MSQATQSQRAAVFVTAEYALESPGGGVQRCTREYVALLEAAGFTLQLCPYAIDRRPLTRLRRLLARRPYRDLIPRRHAERVIDTVRRTAAQWVFLNQTEAGPLASHLRELRRSGVRIALLSHGTDSSDFLHNVRIESDRRARTSATARQARWLGQQLFAEMEFHRLCDVVFCLSETDRQLEQWLGATNVHVIPRAIADASLDWTPCDGRVGTVSTLNHGPNIEGLERLCDALATLQDSNLRLRVVGRPAEAGRTLQKRFPFVEYLGSLDDSSLEAEARTWCAFVNPIFCYPRGSSTKLAVPLSWRIPVITTRAGARGYVWDESLVPLLETPEQMAGAAQRLARAHVALAARRDVTTLAERSPTLGSLVSLVQSALA